MAEYWDIYDKKGKKKNRVIKRGQPLKQGEYHIIVEGWIRVGEDSYIIQKRAETKSSFAGMWYCSAGGSVLSGEDPKDGMIRETYEELGLDISTSSVKLKRIITEKNVFFYIYLIDGDFKLEDIVLQKEEVADAKIATVPEILKMVKKGDFIDLEYYESFFKSVSKTR